MSHAPVPSKPAPAAAPKPLPTAPIPVAPNVTAEAPKVDDLAAWTEVPADAMPVEVRGAKDWHRKLSHRMITSTPNGFGRPASDISEDDIKVIRRLVSVEGFRLRVREGMLAIAPGGTPVLCKVLSAVKRPTHEGTAK